jgi:hypothetical protein
MQSAWKEWFAQRQIQESESAIESPQVIDAREVALETDNSYAESASSRTESLYEEPAAGTTEEVMPKEELYTEEESEQPVQITRQQPVYEPQRQDHQPERDMQPVAIHHAYRQPIAQPREIQPSYYAPQAVPVMPLRSIQRPAEPRATYVGHQDSDEPVIRTEAVLGAPARKERRQGSNTVIRTILIGVILIVAGIAVIGTGFGDRFNNKQGVQYKAIHFINGTSQYSK